MSYVDRTDPVVLGVCVGRLRRGRGHNRRQKTVLFQRTNVDVSGKVVDETVYNLDTS